MKLASLGRRSGSARLELESRLEWAKLEQLASLEFFLKL